MADEQKDIIIDIEVQDNNLDQKIGDINTELKENRKQIKELNKDYKANAKEISVLERNNRELSASKRDLIKESKAEKGSLNELRLELAKQTKERNNLNLTNEKSVKRFNELQDSIKDLSDVIGEFEQVGGDFRRNVGNYPEILEEATEGASIFGFSIQDLTGGLSKLLNPITATLGIVGALGAAYVSTGRGTADLARASDRLDTAVNDLSNSIADLVTDSEGGGILDTFLKKVQTQFFGIASTIRSNVIVAIKEQVREFELAQIESDRLGKSLLDQIEQQRQIRDEERNTIRSRGRANQEVLKLINEREENLLVTQRQQIKNIELLLKLNPEDLELKKQLLQAEFELADIAEESSGFRSEQLANDLALARENSEQRVALTKAQLEEDLINIEEGSRKEFEIRTQIITESLAIQLEAVGNNILERQILEQEATNELLRLEEEFLDERTLLLEKESTARRRIEDKSASDALKRQTTLNKKKEQLEKQALGDVRTILGEGENIQKAFALTEIGVDTAKAIAGLTASSEANPANAFTFGGAGIAQFAAGLIRIAANIASASRLLGASTSVPSGASGGAASSAANAASGGLAQVNAALLSQFSTEPTTASENAEQALANFPPINVAVSEINEVNSGLAVKVKEAQLG